MAVKKTVVLNQKLHEALKIRAVKENSTLEALISKLLWHSLGGVIHDEDNH